MGTDNYPCYIIYTSFSIFSQNDGLGSTNVTCISLNLLRQNPTPWEKNNPPALSRSRRFQCAHKSVVTFHVAFSSTALTLIPLQWVLSYLLRGTLNTQVCSFLTKHHDYSSRYHHSYQVPVPLLSPAAILWELPHPQGTKAFDRCCCFLIKP